MVTIVTLGPDGSHAWQAARQYNPAASLLLLADPAAVAAAPSRGEADYALLPVSSSREGHHQDFCRLLRATPDLHWVDNVVLPVHLSLGALSPDGPLKVILGRAANLRQAEEYLNANLPGADLIAVHDLDRAVARIKEKGEAGHGVIEAESALAAYGLNIRVREITPGTRTRFAVLGPQLPPASGYDATAVITAPLKDRVGLLFAILGEFAARGINLLDMRSETDPRSQELRFFIEMEGHIEEPAIREALTRIEQRVIQAPGAIRVLGAFPRVDMRPKHIRRVGFIGSGEMSQWFADRLAGEGYQVLVTGRHSELRPEAMIPQVDLVAICVPISATVATIRQYGPLLKAPKALVLLVGEAEETLAAAQSHTEAGVEVLLVHNLWGPKAATMKDKNVSVVRTPRCGILCAEFEGFLYKHGANISLDSAPRHNLLMGVSQKLPSALALALAMTLEQHRLPTTEIEDHATLTSIYTMLAMARIHGQNPRTYAEILACPGEGRRILRDFAANLGRIIDLAEGGDISGLSARINANRAHLGEDFLKTAMSQALAVDNILNHRPPR